MAMVTRASPPAIEFRPLAESDLPLLHAWLNQPHVLEWWAGESSLEDVRAKYLPRIDHGTVRPYVACVGSIPIGYIQSYVAVETDDGWWSGCSDPGVLGIDQFVADRDRLGQGLGTAMASQFAARLFGDPGVSRLQVDPRPENTRAIRCYEKAGFRATGIVTTPDGPALLMTLNRPLVAEAKHE
jgi:RimJ/RimL family protein N-acetyltransferase